MGGKITVKKISSMFKIRYKFTVFDNRWYVCNFLFVGKTRKIGPKCLVPSVSVTDFMPKVFDVLDFSLRNNPIC